MEVEVMRIDGHFGGPTRWTIRTSEEWTQKLQVEADRRDIYCSTLLRDLLEEVMQNGNKMDT